MCSDGSQILPTYRAARDAFFRWDKRHHLLGILALGLLRSFRLRFRPINHTTLGSTTINKNRVSYEFVFRHIHLQ
jgi:hypothetical protein